MQKNNYDKRSTVLILKAEYNRLRQEKTKNMIASDEFHLKQNKIVHSILSLLD